MAFPGTFISQIKSVIYKTSNSTASAQPSASIFDDDISSNSGNFDSRPSHENSNEYTAANYSGVLDTELTSLTTAQRHIFIVILTVLFVLSLCGNVCALFVNFRRKIRPFFRACLISLAVSDLMNTVFLTASYLSQFTADFVQIWSLGNVMCNLVPFATTCAILASSMTLVGIALDRYFAVMKAVIGSWNPSVISCIACMLCIWLASISIACPAFTFYNIKPIYILTAQQVSVNATEWLTIFTPTTEMAVMNATKSTLSTTMIDSVIMKPNKPNITVTSSLIKSSVPTIKPVWTAEMATEIKTTWDGVPSYTLVHKQQLVNMCMSDSKNVSAYYVIVFTIIFVPCIVAFFWFNTIIAKKIWERRHIDAITKQRNLRCTKANQPELLSPSTNTESSKTQQPKANSLQNKNCNCKSMQTSSTSTMPSITSNILCGKVKVATNAHDGTPATCRKATSSNNREARHLRMFTIILLMMAVFVFLRLPAWIFLLMRMYGHYTQPRCWIFYFIFGLMNLASSVLNPLFYTFLAVTVKYVLKMKTKVSSLHCGRCKRSCCCCKNSSSPFCRCSFFLCWHSTSSIPDHKYKVKTCSLHQESDSHSKDCKLFANNDNDEGVDCNDELDEEHVCSFHEYSQRIYTIFPSSLVSSSISSEN